MTVNRLITKRIDNMNTIELRSYLVQFNHHFDDETNEWESIDEGVDATHAKIRLYGLACVSEDAPSNWARELAEDIGIGFNMITMSDILESLFNKGWLKR